MIHTPAGRAFVLPAVRLSDVPTEKMKKTYFFPTKTGIWLANRNEICYTGSVQAQVSELVNTSRDPNVLFGLGDLEKMTTENGFRIILVRK